MRNTWILLAVLASTALAAEDDWYPSVHGEGDTLGAINHISPAKVVEAARLVKTGKTYALGVVTGWESPKGWEFLFVLGQPRFEGAVQAVINPVAIL